jgi:uncharacterized protein YgiM (DUF1202 family)
MMFTTPDNTRKIFTTLLFLVLSSLACTQAVVTPTPPAPTTLPPSPTPAATVTPQATGTALVDVQTAIVRAALVNVRANPGGEVVGQIEAGQEVEIVGTDGDWVQIADPAGWVWAGCLSGINEKGCTAK